MHKLISDKKKLIVYLPFGIDDYFPNPKLFLRNVWSEEKVKKIPLL